jgi:hypothetical protein
MNLGMTAGASENSGSSSNSEHSFGAAAAVSQQVTATDTRKCGCAFGFSQRNPDVFCKLRLGRDLESGEA